MKELWVEKYRPKTVDGYVFRDDAQRNQGKEIAVSMSFLKLREV